MRYMELEHMHPPNSPSPSFILLSPVLQRFTFATSLSLIVSSRIVFAYVNAPALANSSQNHSVNASAAWMRAMCPQLRLSAQNLYPSSSNPRSPQTKFETPHASKPKREKKNKYANFSKADHLSMDPFDALINQSREKLQKLHRDREDSRLSRTRKNSSCSEITSLEAVDRLLSLPVDGNLEEEGGAVEAEKRERNKRLFPDTKDIDPYDPTTYGYIELGTIFGAHGVHGLMKLSSITDFSQHRLCRPGIKHIRLPNRRSPREIQLVEGRPLRPKKSTVGTDTYPTYLIRLEDINNREEALNMRGCVLYALEEESVDGLLEEDEYVVSELIGLNVFLDENSEEQSGKSFEELFVGNVCGVIMGSEICAIPSLGQDLLEIALPGPYGGQGDDLVLIPFVPEIVTGVNLKGRIVSVIPPKGLLDLSYRREKKVRIKGLLPPARDKIEQHHSTSYNCISANPAM